MKSGIYEILNTVNGKLYIGSAVNMRARFSCHLSQLRSSAHGNRHLQRAFDKYGEDALVFFPVEHVKDKKKLIDREQFWLNALDVCDISKGYNISPTAGSSLGAVRSPEICKKLSEKGKNISTETRAKMSAAQRARYSEDGPGCTEETRRKLSLASRGRTSPMKGQSHSAESRAKMSESRMGLVPWNKDRPGCYSEEHKRKISASLIGNKYRLGKPHSKETRANMRAAHQRRRARDAAEKENTGSTS